MFKEPIFLGFTKKYSEIILLIFVTVIYITLCAETDMYVPAFPQMIDYFNIGENKIQLVLSVNFAGLCLAGLIAGPFSDTYGRRVTLLGGLFLFVMSSIGCVYTESFIMMLFWRFIQGVSASVPMVIGGALFFDKYNAEKAGKLIGVLNGFISAAMAGAPVVGAWISEAFNWRANFILILALSALSFLIMLFFIEETLPISKRKEFKMGVVLGNYARLIKSFPFVIYSIMGIFSFAAVVVYIANLSVIFINHIGMTLEIFSYYQATTMGVFIVFSLLSVKLIGKYGLDYTKNIGTLLCSLGASGLLFVSLLDNEAVNQICIAMAFVSAGSALMGGTFGSKAMELFPDINGTALAMMTAVRQFLSCALVILSELLFDGTIVPIAILIFACTMISIFGYLLLCLKMKKGALIV